MELGEKSERKSIQTIKERMVNLFGMGENCWGLNIKGESKILKDN